MEKWISGLCLKSDIADIYSENIRRILSVGCFSKMPIELSTKENIEVNALKNEICQQFLVDEDIIIKPGYNPKIVHMQPSLDPVRNIHRPLLLCVMIHLCEWWYETMQLRMRCGFIREYTNGGGSYWIKENLGKPCVFIIHGICRGWSYYSKLIDAIYQDYTVVLFDYDCIKINSFSFHVPQIDEYCLRYTHILEKHRLNQVILVGQSYGTFMCGWLIRKHPEKIKRVLFIDPLLITVGLYENAYYIYHKPPETFLDYLFYFFVRCHFQMGNVIQKHFSWYNHMLKLSDIPSNIETSFFLCDKDELYDFPTLSVLIDQYIFENPRCNKTIWENKKHGDSLESDICIADIIQNIEKGLNV
jgi:pimeloyl-ACP methyl ester carboxylesterase